ncbi:hypothetical protein PoB_000627600 [Plakobranchus ocellatus]|uniref:Uncharacterized protein n=1 Tax=Plakobranchus ocellatus TaxID=259542 RepID=A0AAV3Y975_9GAST|nr:hypothetical protein PoB_000627600 [Plakobranchus ocellatus]
MKQVHNYYVRSCLTKRTKSHSSWNSFYLEVTKRIVTAHLGADQGDMATVGRAQPYGSGQLHLCGRGQLGRGLSSVPLFDSTVYRQSFDCV